METERETDCDCQEIRKTDTKVFGAAGRKREIPEMIMEAKLMIWYRFGTFYEKNSLSRWAVLHGKMNSR